MASAETGTSDIGRVSHEIMKVSDGGYDWLWQFVFIARFGMARSMQGLAEDARFRLRECGELATIAGFEPSDVPCCDIVI